MSRELYSWTDFKDRMNSKKLLGFGQWKQLKKKYEIVCHENGISHTCHIDTTATNADRTDFEDNYKALMNQAIHPMSDDGKVISRTESRPIGNTTVFLCRGDDKDAVGEKIGKGKTIFWDFNNADDDISPPESGTYQKRIQIEVSETVFIKEGTIYFHGAPKGAYIDFYVVCPHGGYYKKNGGVNAGQIAQNLSGNDLYINHFVIHQFMQGTAPMGDELNTEAASDSIPNYMKLECVVTMPDSESKDWNGYVSLELYRERTVILE